MWWQRRGCLFRSGGGIRDMKTVESYLRMGVRWVIIGTAATENPGFVHEACRTFPDQVILGIDANGGRVAVRGWTEKRRRWPLTWPNRFREARPAAIVYTDILRDGTETGVNFEATGKLAEAVGIPVIASAAWPGSGTSKS